LAGLSGLEALTYRPLSVDVSNTHIDGQLMRGLQPLKLPDQGMSLDAINPPRAGSGEFDDDVAAGIEHGSCAWYDNAGGIVLLDDERASSLLRQV